MRSPRVKLDELVAPGHTPADYSDAVIDNTLALLATIATTDELLEAWH